MPAQKLFGWLRRLSGMMHWVRCKYSCGTNASKMAENLLKVIHVLEGLQQAEHLGMLNMYGLQSTKINDWLRELEADLGMPNTTESEILTQDLGMKHIVAKFVLWLLLPEQKEHRAAVGRTVWGPKVPALKKTEVVSSYGQCFLCLKSSSMNVSIFCITWMDTFWADIIKLKRN